MHNNPYAQVVLVNCHQMHAKWFYTSNRFLLFCRISVLEKEDWKSVVEFLNNAKQVVTSVQDVARKVAEYAKFRNGTNPSGMNSLGSKISPLG